MKYDVFISYSSKDSGVAFDVCAMLEAAGLTCWIAPRNVYGGKSYAREIIEAITESQIVLFIFSSYSNCSSHVESEIDIAFNQEKVIIPFRIEEVKMSPELTYYINKKHHIDGIPEPALSFDILKESVLNNIPRLVILLTMRCLRRFLFPRTLHNPIFDRKQEVLPCQHLPLLQRAEAASGFRVKISVRFSENRFFYIPSKPLCRRAFLTR